MVKHATPLLQRALPSPRKLHKTTRPCESNPSMYHRSHVSSSFARWTAATRLATRYQNSPCAARPVHAPRSPGPRSRLHSTNTNRFLAERTQLSTIHEELEDGTPGIELGQRKLRYDDVRTGLGHLEAWPRQGDAGAGSSKRQDVDMFGWDDDDETALVTMLQEK